ncbi:mitochondrial chaperone BCS1 [Ceratobasidium sp. AG-Ba]|nr:mitochondrial chaperone BCS1 [Ceratobasidium sp. AG-Ba]
MESLKGMLYPGSNALQDTLRLVVIGGAVETARRTAYSGWNAFVDSFFLTATFTQDDYPYDWVMHWLSKQPAWSRSREFEVGTRSAESSRMGIKTPTDQELEEDDEFGNAEEDEQLVHGRRKRKVAFMPSPDTTHNIYYRGHWLRITRTAIREQGGRGELKISVVARNNAVIKKLVLQAKSEYEQDMEHRVHIFLADQHGGWRWNGARQKRPMSSIVLEPGVKDMLLADAKDFLRSEDWYAERGIPFRRGYLLHGVPGSGKTSLIHALAGELGLDIYVASLSMKGMSDNTLANLMGRIPSRCILLLEDLDAAFTRGTSRDSKSTGAPTTTTTKTETTKEDPNTLSLSGLLNSLDGVAAAEGRLLFATTNHIERLDPALSRPGRMDVWVDFKNASRWQAEEIFKNFFPCKPAPGSEAEKKAEEEAAAAAAESADTKRPAHRRRTKYVVPLLEAEEIAVLAKKFSENIPEDEMSVASLQGYLLKNKTRPRECVEEVAAWIVKERETKAKLKREKEEKEKQEKEEAEAKEKKEREEKEEKERKEREEKREKRKKEKQEQLEKERKAKAEQEVKTLRRKPRLSTAPTPSSTVVSTPASTTDVTDSDDSDESDAEETKKENASTTTAATDSTKWVNVKNGSTSAAPVSTEGIIETVAESVASIQI